MFNNEDINIYYLISVTGSFIIEITIESTSSLIADSNCLSNIFSSFTVSLSLNNSFPSLI